MKNQRVQKRFSFISDKREGIHTRVSFYLSLLAIFGMLYLGLRHVNDVDSYGEAWGKFALYFALAGSIAFILIEIIDGNGLQFPPKMKPMKLSSLGYGAVLFGLLFIVQIAINIFRFSVSSTDKAMYFIFASVIEELVFRALIIEMILIKGEKNWIRIISAITVSSILFVLVHQNYWGQPLKQLGILFSGLLLGGFYVWRRDLTANIIGHFFINTWAVVQLLGSVNI